jgi:hypothetical protein
MKLMGNFSGETWKMSNGKACKKYGTIPLRVVLQRQVVRIWEVDGTASESGKHSSKTCS